MFQISEAIHQFYFDRGFVFGAVEYLNSSIVKCSVSEPTWKASELKGINMKLLKNGTQKLYRIITTVVNHYLNENPVPIEWKEAHIYIFNL